MTSMSAWNDANYLVRLTRSSPYVQYSNDNGVTWAWMPSTGVTGTGSPDEWNANLGMTAISADGLYVVYQPGNTTTTDNLLIYASRSSLTGAWSSWQAPATNRPPEGAKVVADLVAAHTFYAISGNAAYRSTDGGVNWTQMTTNGAPSSIDATPRRPRLQRPPARFRPVERPLSFHRRRGHLDPHQQPPPSPSPMVWAWGSCSGSELSGHFRCRHRQWHQLAFFRSDDQGATWVTISDLAHQYGYTNLIQGDPRIYGRVYLGAGRGLVYGDIHTARDHPAHRLEHTRHRICRLYRRCWISIHRHLGTYRRRQRDHRNSRPIPLCLHNSYRRRLHHRPGHGRPQRQSYQSQCPGRRDDPQQFNRRQCRCAVAMSPGSVNGAVLQIPYRDQRLYHNHHESRRVESLLGASDSHRQQLHRRALC